MNWIYYEYDNGFVNDNRLFEINEKIKYHSTIQHTTVTSITVFEEYFNII